MKFRSFAPMLARRGAWVVAIMALLVVMALSACGRGSAPQTLQGPTATATLPPTQQVLQTDSDLDAIIAAIDSAGLDANIDDSAKDNIVVP
jgi:hypothetical protein